MNQAALLETNAEKYPNKDFVRVNGKGYTYKQVRDLSRKAAGLFQSLGIHQNDRVSLMSQNTLQFVVAYFGALLAGGTVVPVNHKLQAREVEYILLNSESKLLLFDGSLANVVEKVSVNVKKLSMDQPAGGYESFDELITGEIEFSPVVIEDRQMAQILYTSGTTGKPKGCVLDHQSVAVNGVLSALGMKMDEDSRLLMAMPIWHSSPLNNWFGGIQVVGGTMVLLREYHPLDFLQTIQDERCTIYFGAPISYILPMQLTNFDAFDLNSMKVWIYGGGPISGETAGKIMSRYKSDQFYQVYGMTETGPQGMILPPKDQFRKSGSVGRVGNPMVHIKVMKTMSEKAGPGEMGEIWLKSECMMKKYYNNPDATEKAFTSDGWYQSGDIARLDEDGYLYIVDRTKDMIITGGENVYSKEVEDVISACPGVVEVAVIGVPHNEWGETVTAVIVPAERSPLDEDRIKSFLADKLANYKIPKKYIFTDALPHTPSGKVMKYKLRESYRQPV